MKDVWLANNIKNLWLIVTNDSLDWMNHKIVRNEDLH
jgi:hypothetical protein